MRRLFFLLLSCFLATGCSEQNSSKRIRKSHNITVNIASDPTTLDPRLAYQVFDTNIVKTFSEGLTRIGPRGTATMALADSIALSGDKMTYRVKLKETVWSNSDPLTAHDFVRTFKHAVSREFDLPQNSPLLVLKNASSIRAGQLPQSFLGVYAENDYCLVLELESPVPYFTELLALPAFFPVHPLSNFSTHFVTNGPFSVESYEPSTQLVTKKNPLYWDEGGVYLDELCMVMLDAETSVEYFCQNRLDYDGAPFYNLNQQQLEKAEQRLLHTDPLLGTYWIQPNTQIFPLSSSGFCQALATALDPAEVAHIATEAGSYLAREIVPASFTDSTQQTEAQRLLEEASETVGFDKDNVSLTLSYPADNKNHQIAKTLQLQWMENLGINIQLEPLGLDSYLDRLATGDYQLACGSYVADLSDALSFLEIYKAKHLNPMKNWESPNYAKALESAFLLEGEDESLAQDSSIIPLFKYNMLHIQNESLKDVVLTDSGMVDFRWAYTE